MKDEEGGKERDKKDREGNGRTRKEERKEEMREK